MCVSNPACAVFVSFNQVSEVRQWMSKAGFLPKVATEIADFLEELGVVALDDLADLEDDHVEQLIALVPPVKKAKFKTQLATYRPVPNFLILSVQT